MMSSSSTVNAVHPLNDTVGRRLANDSNGVANALPRSGKPNDGVIVGELDSGIALAELLSSCIDACRRGCEVIRNVRGKTHNRAAAESGPKSTSAIEVKYKDANDPRSALTEADEASQQVIVSCLMHVWAKEIAQGSIKIVGEEGGNVSQNCQLRARDAATAKDSPLKYAVFQKYSSPSPASVPINRHLLPSPKTASAPQQTGDAEPPPVTTETAKQGDPHNENLIVFIDPMDGTREFVEDRVENVQCLIGITRNGIPVGGAVGMPLVHSDKIEVAYGLLLPSTSGEESDLRSGVKYFDAINPMAKSSENNEKNNSSLRSISQSSDGICDNGALIILSGDSSKPALTIAMECLETQVLNGLSSSRPQIQTIPLASSDQTQSPPHPGTTVPNTKRKDRNEVLVEDKPAVRRRKYPPYRKIIAGGCGNKMLFVGRHSQANSPRERLLSVNGNSKDDDSDTKSPKVQLTNNVGAISIAPPGSSSWDTAAPTAVLLSMDPSARVTDLVGRPLIYDGLHLMNDKGVVASSGDVAVSVHMELCQKLYENEHFCKVLGVDKDPIEKNDAIGAPATR